MTTRTVLVPGKDSRRARSGRIARQGASFAERAGADWGAFGRRGGGGILGEQNRKATGAGVPVAFKRPPPPLRRHGDLFERGRPFVDVLGFSSMRRASAGIDKFRVLVAWHLHASAYVSHIVRPRWGYRCN